MTNIDDSNDDSVDPTYNGWYVREGDWNDRPHFVKEDRTTHLFHFMGYITFGIVYEDCWQLSN